MPLFLTDSMEFNTSYINDSAGNSWDVSQCTSALFNTIPPRADIYVWRDISIDVACNGDVIYVTALKL